MNSSLIDCTVLSPNHSGQRNHKVDVITPHCVVGQLSAESIGHCFVDTKVKASCNYGIGTDGRVCLIVDERNRAWTSSSASNDNRAITIECASDMTEPYKFNSKVYEKLIELTVDILKRYNKNKLVYIANKEEALKYEPKDNEMKMTYHRWFKNKSCPGNWFVSKANEFTGEVNRRLNTDIGVSTEFKRGDLVVLNKEAVQWDGNAIREEYLDKVYRIRSIDEKGRAVLEIDNNVIYAVDKKYISLYVDKEHVLVRINTDVLNIRQGPGIEYKVTDQIRDRGIYTILEVKDNWGKLKSGAGWISMKYVERV